MIHKKQNENNKINKNMWVTFELINFFNVNPVIVIITSLRKTAK